MTPASRILIVDDEPQIRRLLDITFRAEGYVTRLAETGQAAIGHLATHGADLVVLDLGLPDRDGLDVLQALRAWSNVPVIVLTVRDDEAGKVRAFDHGADDYVTKPFGVPELMARTRAHLRARTVTSENPPVFDDGQLHVDRALRHVSVGGRTIVLSRKEYALLAYLIQHAGRIVTQPQLLRELWGPTHQHDTHYLRILVRKLRHKLGESATAPRWIRTEPGVGLRFIG